MKAERRVCVAGIASLAGPIVGAVAAWLSTARMEPGMWALNILWRCGVVFTAFCVVGCVLAVVSITLPRNWTRV